MTWEKLDTTYKYRLTEPESFKTKVKGFEFKTDWISLTKEGLLTLAKGYAWDGATKAFDVRSFRMASAAHDALYQLMRLNLLPTSERKNADITMRELAKTGGMNWWRWVRYGVVRLLGGLHI